MTNEQEIERVLTRLAETFSQLDFDAWIKNFHTPTLLVFPDQAYSLENEMAFRALMTPYFQNLRDQGFTQTRMNESQIRILTETTAIVSSNWTRYAGSTPMESIGAAHMFQKSANTWGVIMVTSYPPGALGFA
ncbi:MAG: DUF6841 family protein [bacterium]